jgi:hypothetical protein
MTPRNCWKVLKALIPIRNYRWRNPETSLRMAQGENLKALVYYE